MLLLSKNHPQKRAFITGAASGLGLALARQLAADHWQIGITDIRPEALANAVGELEALGGKIYSFVFDVANRIAFAEAFEAFIHRTGGIDLLINNAGVGDGGLTEEYALEHWEWITGINQMAVIYGTHFAIPHMKKQGSGQIITISSAAAFATMPNMGMYNVTKAAVFAFSETIHAELAPFGIGVSVVMPTFFRSGVMQHHRGPEAATGIGQILVEKAPILPEAVASHILDQSGKGRFHIFYPFEARGLWWFKRMFPGVFLWIKMRLFARKDWVIQRLQKVR
ncbi:MAG: SDR family NAD(P)-dependent oxidoreductase [Chitinophagales bacterium]